MFHQFMKLSSISFNACNLFVAIGDHLGVVPIPLLPSGVMLLLQNHLQPNIGDALR
jgi:hypothetical protein